jgi:hypothetical protein
MAQTVVWRVKIQGAKEERIHTCRRDQFGWRERDQISRRETKAEGNGRVVTSE